MSSLSKLTAGVWNIDAAHSHVGFIARHLMIAKVRGSFTSFSGAITIGEDVEDSKVEATVDLKSITTGDATRDGHLLTADFFQVEANPTMTFVSTGLNADGDEGKLKGDLTINGITKSVTFDVAFEGVNGDPWGGTRAGFSAETEINRKDFGVEFNIVLDAGGVAIGDKVKIQLDIEAVRA
jgi:polyisoprenoid-binding protein YceI